VSKQTVASYFNVIYSYTLMREPREEFYYLPMHILRILCHKYVS